MTTIAGVQSAAQGRVGRFHALTLALLIPLACERKGEDEDAKQRDKGDEREQDDKGDEPVTGRKTLVIDSQWIDCPNGIGKCLRVKQERGEWQPLHSPIEGFDFEEGYIYTIIVDVTEVPDPPTGGETLRYRLLEVVGRTPAP